MVGQEHVKKTLLGQLESGKISHGYLFSGPRGTGKTSTARIFAKAVNCENYSSIVNRQSSIVYGEPCNKCLSCKSITDGSNLDLIEVDAASNRGIDEIRDLREKIKLSPVSSRFKVYIIDEVHMLTNEAFNALLKTLEEPPAHAIFILCTTEPNKLPETIVSRLARLIFSRAVLAELSEYIANIAKKENIKIDGEAIGAIAKEADGSFRDSASILDQISASGETISADAVKKITKASGFGQALEILDLILSRDLKSTIEVLVKLEGSVDFSKLTVDLVTQLKEILFLKIGVLKDAETQVLLLAEKTSVTDIKILTRLLLISEGEMRLYPSSQIPLILAFCDFCSDEVLLKAQKHSGDSGGGDEAGKEIDVVEEVKTEPVGTKHEVSADSVMPKDLADVEAVWGKFLDKIKNANAHVMAVLRNSNPVSFDGKTITLEVFFSFHKDKLQEPKIMDILCGTISEVMDKKVSFSVVLSNRKSKVPKTVSKSDVLDVDRGELTLVAQEIFAK